MWNVHGAVFLWQIAGSGVVHTSLMHDTTHGLLICHDSVVIEQPCRTRWMSLHTRTKGLSSTASPHVPVVHSFLQPRQISIVKAVTAKQHALGIYGAVGEIGVHHGKFLIPIVGNALSSEPAVALDLFEDQTGNVDTSGEHTHAT